MGQELQKEATKETIHGLAMRQLFSAIVREGRKEFLDDPVRDKRSIEERTSDD